MPASVASFIASALASVGFEAAIMICEQMVSSSAWFGLLARPIADRIFGMEVELTPADESAVEMPLSVEPIADQFIAMGCSPEVGGPNVEGRRAGRLVGASRAIFCGVSASRLRRDAHRLVDHRAENGGQALRQRRVHAKRRVVDLGDGGD